MSKKVGRNDICPCGSGKKYKKCCLNSENNNSISEDIPDKRYFELKGKKAEEIVHQLAQKSFLTDWCFLNPKFPDCKELCDLFVVFDDIALIFQIKDLKLHENGKYKKSEVEKNLKQIEGARRKLFELKTPIELENIKRREESFDPQNIKEVFLISVLMGEGEYYYSNIEEVKNRKVHTFTRNTIQIILNELDTITDFVTYLREKERFFSQPRSILSLGEEEELLAFYLSNQRSFQRLEKNDFLVIEDGCWADLQRKPEFKRRKKEDEISYLWDYLIDQTHMTDSEEYEKVARELARSDRFQRRYLSKCLLDAKSMAHSKKLRRRMIEGDGVTYCFFFNDDTSNRIPQLAASCFVARSIAKKHSKVIGIATEEKIQKGASYEFCLIDIPEWTEKLQKEAEELQEEGDIFKKPNMYRVHEDEFPKK